MAPLARSSLAPDWRSSTPGQGWFLAVASFKAYLKLVFFDGASLTPVPPGPLATQPLRALGVREADKLDEAQLCVRRRTTRCGLAAEFCAKFSALIGPMALHSTVKLREQSVRQVDAPLFALAWGEVSTNTLGVSTLSLSAVVTRPATFPVFLRIPLRSRTGCRPYNFGPLTMVARIRSRKINHR